MPFKTLLSDLSTGLGGLALSLLCYGGLGVFFIASLIHAQIKCGGVGREPGCPSYFRCCCSAGKVRDSNPDSNSNSNKVMVSAKVSDPF